MEIQRVINIWGIKKPYNQNIILQIDLNAEEEYVQAGLLFQTFYFPLKLKKKEEAKEDDIDVNGWMGGWVFLWNESYFSFSFMKVLLQACL